MIKIILTDNHKIVREGIKNLLKEDTGMRVVAEAASGKEIIKVLSSCKADVILPDMNMPETDGFELTELISGKYPSVKS